MRRADDENIDPIGLTVRLSGDGEVDGDGTFEDGSEVIADEFIAFVYKLSISETDSINNLSTKRLCKNVKKSLHCADEIERINEGKNWLQGASACDNAR